MKFVSEITIDASEVTIPMLAQLDTTLREFGAPTEQPADWYVEGVCKLKITYEFEAEDLWAARYDLDHLTERLTDVGISEGRVSIAKPRPSIIPPNSIIESSTVRKGNHGETASDVDWPVKLSCTKFPHELPLGLEVWVVPVAAPIGAEGG